ncbi:hypothetical protein EXIGLDRAFT_235152 [Exidia glandulosa HHB12029]|uniref:Uncharacterized protein n=1 Tax=Exidia glandulosa HHB12029 TaxID=1314781 RepID=A0A165E2V2_EXIGL|nr:hypothetical protein EXIGLDRAFT_235152 [Exidia glandulosa HHB12029]
MRVCNPSVRCTAIARGRPLRDAGRGQCATPQRTLCRAYSTARLGRCRDRAGRVACTVSQALCVICSVSFRSRRVALCQRGIVGEQPAQHFNQTTATVARGGGGGRRRVPQRGREGAWEKIYSV